MKKMYIQPETIVVALNVRDNVLQVGSIKETTGADGLGNGGGTAEQGEIEVDAREVIRSRGAWEEW